VSTDSLAGYRAQRAAESARIDEQRRILDQAEDPHHGSRQIAAAMSALASAIAVVQAPQAAAAAQPRELTGNEKIAGMIEARERRAVRAKAIREQERRAASLASGSAYMADIRASEAAANARAAEFERAARAEADQAAAREQAILDERQSFRDRVFSQTRSQIEDQNQEDTRLRMRALAAAALFSAADLPRPHTVGFAKKSESLIE
jgi:hypothetical protein